MFMCCVYILFFYLLYESFCVHSIAVSGSFSFSPEISLISRLPDRAADMLQNALPFLLFFVFAVICIHEIVQTIRKGKHILRILDRSLLFCIMPLGMWEIIANSWHLPALSSWSGYEILVTLWLFVQGILFIADMVYSLIKAFK